MKFLTGVFDTITIVRVYHKDESLCVLVVMTPEGANLILSTYVPDCKADIFVVDSLHVESNSWNSCNDFTEFELVENCSLTGCVQTHHEDTHFFLSEKSLPYS